MDKEEDHEFCASNLDRAMPVLDVKMNLESPFEELHSGIQEEILDV